MSHRSKRSVTRRRCRVCGNSFYLFQGEHGECPYKAQHEVRDPREVARGWPFASERGLLDRIAAVEKLPPSPDRAAVLEQMRARLGDILAAELKNNRSSAQQRKLGWSTLLSRRWG